MGQRSGDLKFHTVEANPVCRSMGMGVRRWSPSFANNHRSLTISILRNVRGVAKGKRGGCAEARDGGKGHIKALANEPRHHYDLKKYRFGQRGAVNGAKAKAGEAEPDANALKHLPMDHGINMI